MTILGFAVYMAVHGLFDSVGLSVFLLVLLVIAWIGWLDDKNDLSRRMRFGVQSVAAVITILFINNLDQLYIPFTGFMEIGLAGTLLAYLWITGAANIYNFMDGVDGIASAQAIGAAVGWIYFAWLWGVHELFVINLFILSAVAVFLLFNWSPARIFMGDIGSLFLGFFYAIMPFLAAYLSESVQLGSAIFLGGLLIWPFLFDGTYTIFRRLFKGENILQAHRSHLYQRLNIAGWEHSRITSLYFIFALLCIGLAILFYHSADLGKLLILAGMTFASFGLVFYVRGVEKRTGTI